MKRIALFTLIALCSWRVIAGDMGSVTSPLSKTRFAGQYFGLGLGGAFPLWNTQANTRITNTLPYLSSLYGQSKVGSNNLLGTLFLGYGFVLNSVYMAPEIYFNVGRRPTGAFTARATNVYPDELLSTYTASKLNAWEEGLDGRLGWIATPNTLLFARVGVAVNNIKLISDTTAYTNGTVTPATKLLNYGASKSCAGLRVGGGIEQDLAPHVAVRADYIYTYYGNFSANDSIYASPLGPILNTTSVRLHAQAMVGSLIYHFAD